MKKNIILTGKKNRYMEKLESVLRTEGHNIITGAQDADMLIFCIDPEECEREDYNVLAREYQLYGLGLLNTIYTYLPFLKENSMKRLCFLTTLRSSINGVSDADHWERIVAASSNMAIRMLFNRLSREGFTFRIFGVENFMEDSTTYAAEYFLENRSLEEESDMHSDEKRLVIRDKHEKEYPW